MEGLALAVGQTIDEQPLALANAVLLAAEGDDDVRRHVHKRGKRGHRPAKTRV